MGSRVLQIIVKLRGLRSWRKWDIIGSKPTRGRGTSLLLAGDAMMEVVGDSIGVSLLMDISIAMDVTLFHLSTSKESI